MGDVTRLSIKIVPYINLIITDLSVRTRVRTVALIGSRYPVSRASTDPSSHFFTFIRNGGSGSLFNEIGSRRSSTILKPNNSGSKELSCQSWNLNLMVSSFWMLLSCISSWPESIQCDLLLPIQCDLLLIIAAIFENNGPFLVKVYIRPIHSDHQLNLRIMNFVFCGVHVFKNFQLPCEMWPINLYSTVGGMIIKEGKSTVIAKEPVQNQLIISDQRRLNRWLEYFNILKFCSSLQKQAFCFWCSQTHY